MTSGDAASDDDERDERAQQQAVYPLGQEVALIWMMSAFI